MRRQQGSGEAPANGGSNFTVFRVPGSRYTAPTPAATASSSAPPAGIPLQVGPSLDDPRGGSGSAHRNSYSSTIPASPPYRESMPDGMGFDDFDSMDSGGIGWMRTGRVVRVKETGQSFRFPLEDEHLPQIELGRQDIAQLREAMEAAIEKAVKNGGVSWMENPTMAPANAKYQWKVHLEKKNCIMYRRKNDSTLTKNFLIRCKLECSLNDVMYGVMSDNTEDERTYLAHVHRDDFLDGAVLQLLARPNVEDPYQLFAVKWAAFQSPVDSMFAIRDQFYVEYSRTVIDPKGQKVVARVFQSINAKDYNAVEREFNFVRNDINWVQLFRVLPGSKDTKVDVSLNGSITFPASANTPSWLANRFLASQYAIVTGMATAGDAKFIVNNQLVSEKPWVPNHERSACNVCFKSFSFLRHRHHCRVCAEIMCTACTLELSLRTSTLPPSLRPEGGLISAEKFCFKCVEQARRDREISLAHELAMSSNPDLAEAPYDEDNKENSSSTAEPSLPQIARSTSTHSVESGGSSLNTAGWSNKVLTTMNRDKPAQSGEFVPFSAGTSSSPGVHTPLRQRTNTAGVDRIRQDNLVPVEKGLKSSGSLPSMMDSSLAPPLSSAAAPPSAMPSTFAKMEESIAAQQMLLRNMLMQGQKMMQQQQQQYYPPPPRSGPQIEVIEDISHAPVPPQRLALPPSTTTIEDPL